jgi:hypothetical protein
MEHEPLTHDELVEIVYALHKAQQLHGVLIRKNDDRLTQIEALLTVEPGDPVN